MFKSKILDNYKLDRNNLDSKMGVFTLNLMAFPIRLSEMSIGVIEFSNKRKGSEFTNLDVNLGRIISIGLAKGLISDEI